MSMPAAVESSGLKAVGDNGTLNTGASLLYGVTLLQAAAAAEITVYDNTAASGTVVANLKNGVNASSISENYDPPIACSTGINFAISGTGAEAVIRWVDNDVIA